MPKVLFIGVGFAPYFWGSGIVYQEDLMSELLKYNWDVVYFTGLRYNFFKKPYLKKWKRGKIKFIELVNSPNNREPYNFHSDPLNHCKNSIIENFTGQVIKEERPHIVHITNLQMHCGSIIELIKKIGIPIIKMITDYWELCPQCRLYFKNSKVCDDFDNGKKCVECISAISKKYVTFFDKVMYSISSPYFYRIINHSLDFLRKARKLIVKKRLFAIDDLTLSKICYSSKDYSFRREYFLKILNMVDIIHVESNFVKNKIASYGVKEEKIKVLPTSRKSFDLIKAKPLNNGSFPIKFGYVGGINEHKGVYLLINAFSKLDQKKAKLLIYGGGDEKKLAQFKNLNLEYRGSYLYRDINKVLSEIDVGIVPSIWEEIFCAAGIEFLQAKIPVIASNKGGISEWLKDKINGYFFNSQEPNDLFEKMNMFINNPNLISALQKNILPWKTLADHTKEITNIYNKLLDK